MKTLNKAVARYNGISLIIRILIGLIIGAVLALVAPGAGWVGELGNLFVGALKGIAPVLVISSPGNLELCGDRNLIKLAVPSSRAEFFASLDLAQGVLAGGAPAPRLHIQRSAEEERLICRAKAVLMEVNLMSEAEAHRFLQKYSMDTGLRLAETARLILERYTTG